MADGRESFHGAGSSVPQDTVSPSHSGSNPESYSFLLPDRPGFRKEFSTDMSDDGSALSPQTLSSHTASDFPTSLGLCDNKPDTHAKSGPTHLDRLAIPRQQTNNFDPDRKAPPTLLPSTATLANADMLGGENMPKEDRDKSKNTAKDKQDEAAQDESIDPAPFRFKPFQLAQLLDPKDLPTLTALGGTHGIIRGLGTDPERGLTTSSFHTENQIESTQFGVGVPDLISPSFSSSDRDDDAAPYTGTIDDRKRVYGENVVHTRISKTLPQFMVVALQDKILILLSFAAVIFLALGLFKAFGTPGKRNEPLIDCVEAVAIVVAIAVNVVVGSVNNWQIECQFKALNERKEKRGVKVIRDGVEKVIDIKEVVVGDIALVEPGEIIPCDGIFISGHNVQCDESGATGESDTIEKLSYTNVVNLMRSGPSGSLHTDCFMISGSKVIGGVGRYVVVAVGKRSFNGRILMALRTNTENTPLQSKLKILAAFIGNAGSMTGIMLFVSLIIKFFVELGTKQSSRTPCEWGIEFLKIFIISITLVVIAVPEGLTPAFALALAFATKRMTNENLLVRVLGSCETMANASVICTDKTGTLTQNVMTVVAGSVGIHAKFVRSLDENSSRTNAETLSSASGSEVDRKHPEDFSIDQARLNEVLPAELRDLINEAIAVNSTAYEDNDPMTGQSIFVGSKTEAALLQFVKELNWRDAREMRNSAGVVQNIPSLSDRKVTGVVIKRPDGGYRAYFKGPSEILAKDSTKHIVVRENGNYNHGIEVEEIDELSRENINWTIIFYCNEMLHAISFAYRDFDSWPPEGVVRLDSIKDLTLITTIALEDPLREGARDAVLNCQRAGVHVKMCTGDHVLTARSIAMKCGIFTPGGIIMEGPVFRALDQADMFEILPRLQVLARSSPGDKKILVETLQEIGEIVGVTGDGTDDGPPLKTANVGFSLGIAGTEVAKEASDITLMDNNFASIVKAIMYGRCVNDAVRKFLQFQFSTMITVVVITFVSSLANSPALSPVQLLWISIIMDAFAALALATDPASEVLLNRRPYDYMKTAPLFTVEMYKMILLQSAYQITITLVFYFLGLQILGFENNTENDAIVKTLVFNVLVFALIFNSVNCRRLDSQLNIFEGIFRNRYFIAITLIEIAIQVVIIYAGGAAFRVTRIGGREWGISIALGFISIPWGSIIRLLPTKPFKWIFKAIHLIHEEAVLPFVRQDDQRIPSILTMAPTIMMGAVICDPQHPQAGSRSDPANVHPSGSSVALWEGRLQVHTGTDKDDPHYIRYAAAMPQDS